MRSNARSALQMAPLPHGASGNLERQRCNDDRHTQFAAGKRGCVQGPGARGLSLEQWMLDVADQSVEIVSIAHLQKTDPEEWARHFDAWVDSHDPNTPVLSDEAMSRESIYPDLI